MSSNQQNLAQQIGHANAKRSAARLAAVQALYQMDVAGTDISDVLSEFESNYFSGAGTSADTDADISDGMISNDSKIDTATSGDAQDGAGEAEELIDHSYFEDILKGILKSQTELDPIIDEQLREGWRLNRLDSTLRAILRAGAYELKSRKELSVGLIIDEYLNIAHAFFEGDEPKVVNGVLDKLGKRIRSGDMSGDASS